MMGGDCSPLGAKSSYLNSGSSTRHNISSGGAPLTTAEQSEDTKLANTHMGDGVSGSERADFYLSVCSRSSPFRIE